MHLPPFFIFNVCFEECTNSRTSYTHQLSKKIMVIPSKNGYNLENKPGHPNWTFSLRFKCSFCQKELIATLISDPQADAKEFSHAQGLWSPQEENRKQPGCDLAGWGQCYCCTSAHFGSVLKWYVSIIALVQKQEIINQRLSRGRVWAELKHPFL